MTTQIAESAIHPVSDRLTPLARVEQATAGPVHSAQVEGLEIDLEIWSGGGPR